MTESDGSEVRPASASSDDVPVREASPRVGTLPPPTWVVPQGPMSAATLALEQHEWEAPVPRRIGPRAELTCLERAVARAASSEDTVLEREAAVALARALVARGVELTRAIDLGLRALELREEPKLRAELAQWIAALGQPARAAEVLGHEVERETGVRAVRTRTRVALLQARAGDARAMAETLQKTLEIEPTDPVPAELLGAVNAWAPDVVSSDRAAQCYLEGSRRRLARADRLGAIEDLVRAFEAAPASSSVVEALAETLRVRGRAGAADEVLREHAEALGEAGMRIHRQRVADAARDHDIPRALGALLDAGLDALPRDRGALVAALDPSASDSSPHPIFSAAGLEEWSIARLELALPRLTGPVRARFSVLLGTLYFDAVERVDRAVEAWVDALVADPSSLSARAQLRLAVERTRDPRPLLDALSFIVHAPTTEPATVLACFDELAELGRMYGHAALRSWAQSRRAALAGAETVPEPLDELPETLERHAAELSRALHLLRNRAETGTENDAADAERGRLLAFVERALWAAAPKDERVLGVLAELAARTPGVTPYSAAFERRLRLLGRTEELALHFSRLAGLESRASPEGAPPSLLAAVRARARLSLVLLCATAGDLGRALDEGRVLLNDPAAPTHAAYLLAGIARGLEEPLERARALTACARHARPPIRAVMLCVAAELLQASGDLKAARRTAGEARSADPSITRVAVLEARLAFAEDAEGATRDIERAMGIVLPRSALCGALARAYQAQGEAELALAWAQRQLVLRPGDLGAAATLLRSVLLSKDGGRVAGTLTWLLSQPLPIKTLSGEIVVALRHLADLEVSAAAKVGRRALDVLGPHSPELRDAVMTIADRADERGLGLTLLERWLATNPNAEELGPLLLDLAERRKQTGDADGAARTLARAAFGGADPRVVLSALGGALTPRGSDGEISLLETRARALRDSGSATLDEQAEAWRTAGAARWDLALDPPWAIEAWQTALELEPEKGTRHLARDLVTFGGHAEAMQRLSQLAEQSGDARARARFLAAAASVALHANVPREAQALAIQSLKFDPQRADALTAAERTATAADAEAFEEVYTWLAHSARGCYGERAAHYRAARHFEKHGQTARALTHAIAAFEAVPSEGVTLVGMLRLADALGDFAPCVAALSRVGHARQNGSANPVWLKYAAELAEMAGRPSYERTDLLLRALAVSPSLEALARLGTAMRDLLATEPEEREGLLLRFERAVKALQPRLQGAAGAAVALKAAEVSLVDLAAPSLALRVLHAALGLAADLPEYAQFRALAEQHIEPKAHADAALVVVNLLSDFAASASRTATRPALELGAWLAARLGRMRDVARLLVRAAELAPEDLALLERARAAAGDAGDEDLMRRALQAMPPLEQLRQLESLADAAEAQGDLAGAIALLARARAVDAGTAEGQTRQAERLMRLYRQKGSLAELEAWLDQELATREHAASFELRAVGTLVELLRQRGDFQGALERLHSALLRHPDKRELLVELERTARAGGDFRELERALELEQSLTQEPAERLRLRKELALSAERLGELDSLAQRWNQVLELDPADLTALAAVERDAERRGDYVALVDALERRAHYVPDPNERRRLRLARAKLLEERLGNLEGARESLELLIEEGDLHLGVVTALAELYQRMGSPARAAPLFAEALGMAPAGERLPLVFAAAENYLQADEVERAREVVVGVPRRERDLATRELLVLVERRRKDAAALALALQDLAETEVRKNRRAELLLEAAHAALAARDLPGARGHARAALAAQPSHAPTRLLEAWLGYLESGPSFPSDRKQALAALEALLPELEGERLGLLWFLLAELLDAEASGSALSRLEVLELSTKQQPLVALALAERLSQAGNASAALEFYEQALLGDLQEVRTKLHVSLAAARVALGLEQHERALRILSLAAGDDGGSPEVQELRRQVLEARAARALEVNTLAARPIVEVVGPVPPTATLPLPVPAPLPRPVSIRRPTQMGLPSAANTRLGLPGAPTTQRTGEQKRRTQLGLGAPVLPPPAATPSAEPTAATPNTEPTTVTASAEPTLSAPKDKLNEPGPRRLESRPSLRVFPPLEESQRETPMERALAQQQSEAVPEIPALAVGASKPNLLEPPVHAPAGAGYASGAAPKDPHAQALSEPFAAQSVAELEREFEQGSLEAGRALIGKLESLPEMRREHLTVCERLVFRAPGDLSALRHLTGALNLHGNKIHARAIEHVLGAFEGGATPRAAPNLDDIEARPELVERLLSHDVTSPALDALAMVWETAGDAVRREVKAPDDPDAEPVSFAVQDGLSWRYAASARLLGQMHVPLLVRATSEAPSLRVLLKTPPALLLSGLVTPTSTEFAFHLGAMLAATRPQFALLFGASEKQGRAILGALAVAFGPPVRASRNMASSAHLAEALWQTVPPRVQRQLKELCKNPQDLEYETALSVARRIVRRAGLLVAGDLRVALQEVCAEDGLPAQLLGRPLGLRELCERSPVVSDLVRFATSEGYAGLRWQSRRAPEALPGASP